MEASMSATYEFNAKPRSGQGRRAAADLRAQGKLPANVYGRGEKSVSVEVDYRELNLLYQRTIGKNALLTMKLEGKDSTVMFKDVQREPVKDKFLHIDFYHVDPAHPIKLRIPVLLTGVPKGVREEFGILDHPTRSVLVRCLPTAIPAEIKVDVSALGLDDSLMLQDVTPPAGVIFLSGKHTVLAHVSVPPEEKAPEVAVDAAGAAGSPEVLKEKKEGEAAVPGAEAKPGEKGKAAPAEAAKAGDKGKAAPAEAADKGKGAPPAKPKK
jgi:large subunit ribosomal protein L25